MMDMNKLSKSQKLVYDMEKYACGSISVICGSMLIEGNREQEKLIAAVNELFRLNSTLRTRIKETEHGTVQFLLEYSERNINVLHFDSKEALDHYAGKYAQEPFDLYDELCEISVVLIHGHYGLLVKFHHIIGDAWTIALIGTQYNMLLNGEMPMTYPYADYLTSEAEYLQSSRYAKSRTFFLEQFKKCNEVIYLSEKHIVSFASNRRTFVVKGEKAQQINSYSKTQGVSPFVLFLTTVAMYINRIKQNADKFYIGTTILNRTGVREKNTMGMFVNTVPVLIELKCEKSVAENLAAVKKSTFSIFRHQKFNYGDVLAEIRKEYGFTERLYDVVVSYQNAVITGAENHMGTTWYHSGAQVETLQIHIDDRDSEAIFRIHFDYQTDKFTEYEIERMYEHMMNLLFDTIKDDSKPMYNLEILSANEKQKLLYDFNDTVEDYPRDKCVYQLFEEQARKTPEKTAIIACDRVLTFGELNEQANRIAHSLIERGIKPGDIVAFMLPRKSHLIATMFGILKAGAAYLPIDPDYPQDRIDYIIQDSKAAYFITETDVENFRKSENAANPNIILPSNSLCYCIYTSGTTGQPKGVLISHSCVLNFVQNNCVNSFQKALIDKCCTVVCCNSVTFDIVLQEIFLPLLNGISVFLLLDTRIYSHGTDLIPDNKLGLIITPTKLELYMKNEQFLHQILPYTSVLMCGAEPFPAKLFYKIRKYTDADVFNGYGPTETTCGVLYSHIKDATNIAIGKPIANTQIYIVDHYMQPVPIGVTGELCIAGDGVGVGYLNRSELTAEKFIDNPFGKSKLYKTGDLSYWREDGNIVYVGRNDFQVKIRGLRIELGEIENALQEVQGITQAVVIVRKAEDGRQLICAFYTGREIDRKILRNAIDQKLPKYMLPHSFTYLNELPHTISGKVNRKALPEVDLSRISTAIEYIEPTGELETKLAVLMEKVLSYSPIGREDDFFDLGGDSLKGVEFLSAMERVGYCTDIKTLFECRNVRNLAARVVPLVQQLSPCTESPNETPATSAQMRIFTAYAMQDGTAYNVPYAFRVGSVEPGRLQKAVQALVDRHEILRTYFKEKDGQIVQIVNQTASIRIEQLCTEDISTFIRPFDLSEAPLCRVGYCENTVMVDMHHIITDGASMPIFLRELNELYMGRTLTSVPVPYRQFAMEQQDYKDSEAYWLSVYADELPVLELNTDFKREPKRNFSGSALYETLDSTLQRKILEASRGLDVTPYVFYIAGFYILLSKFSNNEDIIVGTPMSGRAGVYLDTIGMFVNTVALRGKPVGTKTVREFLTEVKCAVIDAVTYQDYPFGELVKRLEVNTIDRNPLFDVMFAYQNKGMTDVVFGDERSELLPIPVTNSKYDFTLNLMPMSDRVTIMIEYCTALYRKSTMRRFIAGYKLILSQMLDERLQLKDISAITEQETNDLLHVFNDSAVDYPRDKCVHQLFEAQARKMPEKTAVIACDGTLTYRELNENANRIAHCLMEQGVKPGDIVAFMLPRRSYLIATIFGILKVGAAYLPIDMDSPRDRIDYMMEDSGAKLLITSKIVTELLCHRNSSDLDISMTSDSLCYCIYTSGSTGNPKGVQIRHRNFVNFCRANQHNRYQDDVISNGTTLLSTFKCCFDAFGGDYSLLLLNGRSVLLASEDDILDAKRQKLLAQQYQTDILQTTPSVVRSLCADSEYQEVLKRAKVILLAAENISPELIHYLRQYSDAIIYNGYGPSETTVGVCFGKLDDEDITIGRPIANTQIYIVDRYMKPVPIGVTGELCVAGDSVGVGYLNCPELTEKKFIANPFGDGKLYKTGDLAYRREDGNIVYVGRNDFQVKIRGLRIELGEIENALQEVQGIVQAVATVRKSKDGQQLICAFYTGQKMDGKMLRAAIGEKVPKYMLPHSFIHLNEIPITTSGKVNRKALPEVDLNQSVIDVEYVKPEGEMEIRLVSLMEQVLDYSPIGRDDDFFNIGGDSLKAIEFISKAHSEGIHFAIQSIFEYSTVRQLAEYIQAGDKQKVPFYEENFTEINKILSKNKLEYISSPHKIEMGNLLLAGATGYLGIHILVDFIEHENGLAYCLVRGKDLADSEQRLRTLLSFYFKDQYIKCDRIKVLCADLQKERFGLTEQEYVAIIPEINTVINAAASVKHYGSYQYFYEANVTTVKHLIEFCWNAEARLIHTSTLSVSGNSFGDEFSGYISETEKHFFESNLYIGQSLDNVYARSKFEAERVVLTAMEKGLKANIMRMGNLTNRVCDGVFQKNYGTNAFLTRVKAILELGMIPDYIMDIYAEFTPVDEAARAVMTIAQHFSTDQTVFHINSTKKVYLDRLCTYFSQLGYQINIVDATEFTNALRKTMKQNGMKHIFEAFINDLDVNDHLNYDSNIRIENDFTSQYLQRLGFEWSDIGLEYFQKYVAYLKKLVFEIEIYNDELPNKSGDL